MAAQEQVIRKNTIKTNIDKIEAESKCRLCGKVDETVRHTVCKCPCWHKGSIKGGMTGWTERYIGKYAEKLVLMYMKNSINMSQRK